MSKIATLNQIGSAAMTGKAYTDARLDALTLGALADANVPANAANGSLLAKQSGKWTAVPVATAIGGTPVTTTQSSAQFLYSSSRYQTLQSTDANGVIRQAVFDEVGKCVIIQKRESGASSWTRFVTIQNALETALTGLDSSKYGNLSAGDTVLSALGKLTRRDYTANVTHSLNGNASSGSVIITNLGGIWATRYSGNFRGVAAENVKEKFASIPSGFPDIFMASMFFTIAGGMYQLTIQNSSSVAAAERGIFVHAARAATNKPDWSFGTQFLCT